MENLFLQISVIIIVAAAIAYIMKLLKQPVIPAYIITGILIGPGLGVVLSKFGLYGFQGFITDRELIENLSEIGIAFLLFIVGIEIDFSKIKDVSSLSAIGGVLTSLVMFSMGIIIAHLLGIVQLEAIYIGLIVAFSSTMVVLKLLSDKHDLETLHGRIMLGILLVEDFFAILALSLLTTIKSPSVWIILIAVFKVAMLILAAYLATRFVLPPLFKVGASSQQMLFLLSIAVCFVFSILARYIGAGIYYIIKLTSLSSLIGANSLDIIRPGISIAIGAFIAGVCLANLPYNYEIIGRIKPLRDFFSIMFFVSLGMVVNIGSLNLNIIWIIIVLSLFVLVFKPFLIMVIFSALGYRKKTSFSIAVSLAQISEFSLIIVAQGFLLGHISDQILSITVILAIITISATAYLIKYDNYIFNRNIKFLEVFEKIGRQNRFLEFFPIEKDYEAVLVGYHRLGYTVLNTLKKRKEKVVVIDYNPEVIKKLIEEKTPCLYGDISNIEIIQRLNFNKIKIVISTIPEKDPNMMLIKEAKKRNRNALIFVTSHDVEDSLDLYDAGADYVILPHFLGGETVSLLLEEVSLDASKLIKTKLNHLNELRKRSKLGHRHPKHSLHQR